MVCNARKAAVARMAERATPLTVPAHVLTVGKASIVAKGVAKTPRHMDPIVLSSVLVTGTTLSCKCLFGAIHKRRRQLGEGEGFKNWSKLSMDCNPEKYRHRLWMVPRHLASLERKETVICAKEITRNSVKTQVH